jgi:hypothetical protein
MSETEIRSQLLQIRDALQQIVKILEILQENDQIIFEILKQDN